MPAPSVSAALCLTLVIPITASGNAFSLSALLRRETSTLRSLSRLTSRITAAREKMDDLERDRGQLQYQVSEAQRRIDSLERKAGERHARLKTRLRGLYKASRGGIARLVFDAAGGGDLASRLAAARLILRRDLRESALYKRELGQLQKERKTLRTKLARSRRIKGRMQEQVHALEKTLAVHRRALLRVRRSRRRRVELKEELTRRQRWLLRRIAVLDYRIRRGGRFTSRRGRLRRPVAGSFIRRLARGSRLEILRHGATLRASRGTRVRAVAPGVVRLADPLEGYGKIVLLEHKDGYFTLYGFLSRCEVSEGQRVWEGATLGRVGLDPLSGRPAAYFEIRRGERALDPVAWLRP